MRDPGTVRAGRSRPVLVCSPASRGLGCAVDVTLDRRTVLSSASVLAVTAAVAGCGDRAEPSDPAPGTRVGSPADVPVHGGTVFPEHHVVVTQSAEGTFHAFSAVCTHQGCTVAQVSEGTIDCPCHGSRFDVTDGSVVRGPADQPLARIDIAIEGSSIRLA